ncbi:CDC27 family protein [Priestia koreensis]|uniref:CDC27 family protein n=1 Tax=Priestia koreensis TaxID=284581 RepID=UPI0028F74C85|nr:tetratricopeptide repeat protein [Priestia koreensis]
MDIVKIRTWIKENKFLPALQEIYEEIRSIQQQKSVSFLKQRLSSLQSVDDFYYILRLLDQGHMYHYTGFIARYAHRRFNTLRTLVWVCDEWVDEGKALDAMESLEEALQTKEYSLSDGERARFTIVRALLEMRRYDEALLLMQVIEKEKTGPVFDKWGYFYLQLGEVYKAEAALKQGMDERTRGYMCRLLLIDLKAAAGQAEEALQLAEEGEDLFPDIPSFSLERVRRLRGAKRFADLPKAIDRVEALLPFHVYKGYVAHLRVEALYRLNKIEEARQFLAQTERLQKSPYRRLTNHPIGNSHILPIKPVVQQHNYCVPASMEMMLTLFGARKSQVEIASTIFDVTGSKLSTTAAYLRSLGFSTRFFVGSVDRLKKLLDMNIPILISIDMEHTAHVQVVFGYDDTLAVLHVQDPNNLEPNLVSYEEFQETYANTHYMCLVFAPSDSKSLNALPQSENVYFEQMYEFAEKMEEDASRHLHEFVAFLQNHQDILYTPLYVVKHFHLPEQKDFILECAERLKESASHHKDIQLQIAYSLVQLNELDEANNWLTKVTKKRQSPMYNYLKGRIAFQYDRYDEAIHYFRRSLEGDWDQPYVWSYMALSSLYEDEGERALHYSEIAVMTGHEEVFVHMNHALILREQERVEEARMMLDQLIRHHQTDPYLWYERAKCDEILGKNAKAIRGYCTAKALDSTIVPIYESLVELYEQAGKMKLVEPLLKEGIQNVLEPDSLYLRLGDFYHDQEHYQKALAMYQECLDRNSEEVFAHIGSAHVFIRQQQYDQAFAYLQSLESQFSDRSDFLINAGQLLFAEGMELKKDHSLLMRALDLFEAGLLHMTYKEETALELYVQALDSTTFLQRGYEFVGKLKEIKNGSDMYDYYAALFAEKMGNVQEAIATYELIFEQVPKALSRLGELYKGLGALNKAKSYYERSMQVEEASAEDYLSLAEIAFFEEDKKAERYYLLQAFDQNPMDVNMAALAALSTTNEDYEQLIQLLQNIHGKVLEEWRLDSLAYVYEAVGKDEQATVALRSALKLNENHLELQKHYAAHVLKTNPTETLKRMRRLIEQNPHREDFYSLFVMAADSLNETMEIPKWFKGMSFTDEEQSMASVYTAMAVGENEEASEQNTSSFLTRAFAKIKGKSRRLMRLGLQIDLYEKAMKLHPDNELAYEQLAHLYEKVELVKDAVKVLKKGLNHSFSLSLADQLLILHLTYSQELDPHEAIPFAEQMMQEAPDEEEIWVKKAFLLEMMSYDQEAEQLFLRAIEKNPYTRNVHQGLGALYHKMGRYTDAVRVLEEGTNIHSSLTLQNELSRAYYATHQVDKALALTENVLRADESFLEARYNQACYLTTLHRYEEANEQLQRVLKEDESGFFKEQALIDEDLEPLRLQGLLKA